MKKNHLLLIVLYQAIAWTQSSFAGSNGLVKFRTGELQRVVVACEEKRAGFNNGPGESEFKARTYNLRTEAEAFVKKNDEIDVSPDTFINLATIQGHYIDALTRACKL